MFRIPRARVLASVLAGAALSAGQPLAALAAAPTAEFAVSPAQMQALDVTVRKLDQPAAIAGLASPARVVLPPNQDVMVSAPVDGVIDRLLVNPQDVVKTGQPLLRMASPAYGELQLKLMEADSRAKLARQASDREKQLFAEGIIPERRVQEAQAAQSGSDAAVRQAQAALRLAGADVAAVRRAAASGKLDDTLTVRARSDGLVVSLDAKLGQRVKEADPLLRIANLRELWLEVQVAPGVTVPRGGEITVVGREVTAVALSVGALVGDAQTQTLRARVMRGADQLRPGEVVQARVPFAAGAGWSLPLAAVTYQDDKAYVFVRSAKGFVATPVTVLSSAGQAVQVRGALQSGQEVAVSSVIALKSAWLGKGGGE
ncbi:MAG: efflux RND transporter periplasmic adaptor subunit [Roseateles sp.]|uniref:efflux RND transporter periplasmic adaptor subunit n=1 Tax=Roseateles sp. TaxID=1971397 RepID=UPI004037179B